VINTSPNSFAGPFDLVNVNGTLVFQANDGTHGWELWRSDGTAEGTVLLKDISQSDTNQPDDLTEVNGRLYFTQNGLWKTDGTPEGTVQVLPNAIVSALSNVGGKLLFSANDGINGAEPWMSDGTPAGTRMLANVNPGASSSSPGDFFAVGSRVVFAGNHLQYGRELWSLTVSSWHNFTSPLNVDGSSEANNISPIDAVLVINYLNAGKGGEVPAGAATRPPFLDVDGDNFVSPIDAVLVINWLNGQPAAAPVLPLAGEGEGLAATSATDKAPCEGGMGSGPHDALLELLALDWSGTSAIRRRRQ
jgi:ELWxxDGT repeat protein